MADELDDLLTTPQPSQPSARKGAPPPPSIEIGKDGTGEAVVWVSDPQETAAEVARIGQKMGLPVEFLDIVRVKAYGKPDDPMYSVHANVRKINLAPAFDDLMKRVRRRRPRRRPEQIGDRTLVVGTLTDAQSGKGDPVRLMNTWDDAVGHIEDRIRDLKKLGRPVSCLYALGGGDTTEGCGGDPNYPGQDRMVTLNQSQQIEVATEMLDRALDRWSAKVGRVITTTVSSNHDANRNGKDYPMGREDCRAFTIWRGVARAFRKNDERYGHVEFWLPEDPDVAVVDLHGVGVAAIHGDLATKSPTNLSGRMWDWWKGQMGGGLPAGSCDVLNTAHFHHKWDRFVCGKVMFGHPAMDIAGSKWFTDVSGEWSYPGILSYVVDASGVSDIDVMEFPDARG